MKINHANLHNKSCHMRHFLLKWGQLATLANVTWDDYTLILCSSYINHCPELFFKQMAWIHFLFGLLNMTCSWTKQLCFHVLVPKQWMITDGAALWVNEHSILLLTTRRHKRTTLSELQVMKKSLVNCMGKQQFTEVKFPQAALTFVTHTFIKCKNGYFGNKIWCVTSETMAIVK